MDQAEMGLREAGVSSEQEKIVRSVLREIARLKGHDSADVSRAQIMLNPASASAWSHLTTGEDVLVQLALKLARIDKSMEAEELSELYEKSRVPGDVQSGIMLCPWRTEGWNKLVSLM
jgi:hypothetical protein